MNNKLLVLLLAFMVVVAGCGGDNSTPTTPDPATTPDSESSYNERVEHYMHEYVNDIRDSNGLNTLSHEEDLRMVAREHSKDMAERQYFSHNNPEGQSPFDRMGEAGIQCWAAGENILYNYGAGMSSEDAAHASIDQWMNSPGHRANILSSNYNQEGIGVWVDNEGRLFATQVFCSR